MALLASGIAASVDPAAWIEEAPAPAAAPTGLACGVPARLSALRPEYRLSVPADLRPVPQVRTPLSPSWAMLGISEPAPHKAIATVVNGESVGLLALPSYDDDGVPTEPRKLDRVRPVSPETAARDLPPEVREEFVSWCAEQRITRIEGHVARFIGVAAVDATTPAGVYWGAVMEEAENLGRKQRKDCGRLTFEWLFVHKDGRTGRSVFRMLCKSDRCPRCAALRAAIWRKRIHEQLVRDERVGRPRSAFLTVTLDPGNSGVNEAEAVRLLTARWEVLTRRLRRMFRDLAFVRVIEWHRSGMPHMHALLRAADLDFVLVDDVHGAREMIARMANEVGFGRTDIGLVRSISAVAADVAKPDQTARSMPRSTRRYQASGKAGDRRDTSFFADELGDPTDDVTVPAPPAEPNREVIADGGDARTPRRAPPTRPVDPAIIGSDTPKAYRWRRIDVRTDCFVIHRAEIEAVAERTNAADSTVRYSPPGPNDHETVRTPDGKVFSQVMSLWECPSDRSADETAARDILAWYRRLALHPPSWCDVAELEAVTARLSALFSHDDE